VKIINIINPVIRGTGKYLPDFTVENKVFEQIVDTSDEWIFSRTGIKERRIEQKRELFEMMGEAAKIALKNADIQPHEINAVIVSTVSGDYNFPSAACLVQNYIGAYNAFGFDISAACAGVIFAIDMADLYIKSGRAKNVLVIAGDMMTRYVDFYDRTNCVLLGDGAGAVVLSAEDGENKTPRGVLASYLSSECDGDKPWNIYSRNKLTTKIFDEETKKFLGNSPNTDNSMRMNGREVYQFAVKAVPKAIDEVLARANITIDDVKYVVAHQANKRILDSIIERYNLEPEKMPINIDKYANMSSCTIPILLH
jgi:3-oxoacyl-[acyl-carrier-protein] synthase-3